MPEYNIHTVGINDTHFLLTKFIPISCMHRCEIVERHCLDWGCQIPRGSFTVTNSGFWHRIVLYAYTENSEEHAAYNLQNLIFQPWRWKQYGPTKQRYPPIKRYGVVIPRNSLSQVSDSYQLLYCVEQSE